MRSAEKIKRLFAKSNITVDLKVDDRIIGDALTVLDKSERIKSVSAEPNIWRMVTKSRLTKLAAAALIIIAMILGINHLGGSMDGANVAWGDVLEEMKNVRSVTFKEIFLNRGGESVITVEVTLMKPGYERRVPSDDTHPISFVDHTRQRTLDIYPDTKMAVVIQSVGWGPRTSKILNYFRWFEDMQNKTGECIDQEEIDGKIVHKFFVPERLESMQKRREITLWVDPETNLPVQVKIWRPLEYGGTIIMNDFVWNPELDESMFIFDPPEGYTVREIEVEIPGGRRPRREPNSPPTLKIHKDE